MNHSDFLLQTNFYLLLLLISFQVEEEEELEEAITETENNSKESIDIRYCQADCRNIWTLLQIALS